MTCVKCKNPIDVDAIECEWCGMSFSNNAPKEPKTTENKINTLDSELLALLEKGQKKQAIKLHRARTGELYSSDSAKYIERLDFFRKHKDATEETWKKRAVLYPVWLRLFIWIMVIGSILLTVKLLG